jgi:hypothetical protein
MKLILAILLIGSLASAECANPVSYLKQGQPALCAGYLFSPEMELQVRTEVIQYAKLKEVSAKQDELIDTLNQRITNQQNQMRTEEKAIFINKAIYFAAGLGIGYLISNVSK